MNLRAMKFVGLICTTLIAATATLAPASAEPDVALDFNFLKMGSKRAEVIKLLGEPTMQQSDKTIIFIAWRKLSWIADQRRHIAWFVHDRLVRTRICDLTDPAC
jgi:hypothetical protein